MLSVVRLIGIGTRLALDIGEHAVLVGPPLGEAREVVDHGTSALVWKDVRAVAMDEDAGGIGRIVGVAGDVVAPVDDEHAPARIRRHPLGQHGAREARADDEDVMVAPWAGDAWADVRRSPGRS